jgi:hypothetical protein
MLLGGLKIIESPLAVKAVLEITPSFPHVSPEFRAQWNAWARDRFGVEPCAYQMGNTLIVGPGMAKQLREKWLAESLSRDMDRRVTRMLMGDFS